MQEKREGEASAREGSLSPRLRKLARGTEFESEKTREALIEASRAFLTTWEALELMWKSVYDLLIEKPGEERGAAWEETKFRLEQAAGALYQLYAHVEKISELLTGERTPCSSASPDRRSEA
jgi:hypothetical protein